MSIQKDIRPYSAKLSLEYFIEQSREKSILKYDQAFEFTVLTVYFSKPRGSFETHDSAVRKIEKLFDRDDRKVLENIAASLPQGIIMRIKEGPAEGRSAYSSSLKYSVNLSVSGDYSKKAFESMAVGNIVHLSPLDPTFLQEATAFEEKLLSSRKETVEKIGSLLLRKYGIVIKKGSMLGDDWIPGSCLFDFDSGVHVRFSTLGLKDLETLAQCYGLAMALIDNSKDSRRGIIRLNKKEGQVEIETCLRPEEEQLQEW